MDNIKEITDNLRAGVYNNNPGLAARARALLGGEYAFVMGQLEIILQRKPALWQTIRQDLEVNSDTQADRVYERTADGVDEAGLKLRAKAIEKMMTGLGSLIKLAEDNNNLL